VFLSDKMLTALRTSRGNPLRILVRLEEQAERELEIEVELVTPQMIHDRVEELFRTWWDR
jgi:hypothetical protein